MHVCDARVVAFDECPKLINEQMAIFAIAVDTSYIARSSI